MPAEAQKQLFYEDVEVGQEITPLVKGPMTTLHLMRWSAAIENWHRIHYDRPYAVEHDKLPDVLVAGSWKQQALVQMLKDWCGAGGWLWKIRYQFRAMDPVGATLTCWGQITTSTYVMASDLSNVTSVCATRTTRKRRQAPPSPSCHCAGTAGALSICRRQRISAEG